MAGNVVHGEDLAAFHGTGQDRCYDAGHWAGAR